MKSTINRAISTVIVGAAGFVVLLGYFVDFDAIRVIYHIFLRWAFILTAIAMIVGTINMLRYHWRNINKNPSNGFFSLVLIISFVLSTILIGFFGIAHPLTIWIYESILIPVETSLLIVIAVFLIYSVSVLLRKKLSIFNLIFVMVVVITLISSTPFFGINLPLLHGTNDIFSLITRLPALAGIRGLLIGIALGSIATGLKMLIGSERPHGG